MKKSANLRFGSALAQRCSFPCDYGSGWVEIADSIGSNELRRARKNSLSLIGPNLPSGALGFPTETK
jgi:hypothetical protein